MKIKTHNLPDDILAVLNEEIALVTDAAHKSKVKIPEIQIHAVCLSNPHQFDNLPASGVQSPGTKPSGSYRQLCHYEINSQSFEIVESSDGLWIIGASDEAVLYGIHTILECVTGLAWTGMFVDDLKFGSPQDLPKGIQKPVAPFRSNDGGAPYPDARLDFIKWMNRNRLNVYHASSVAWMNIFDDHERNTILHELKRRRMRLSLGDHAVKVFLPEEMFHEHVEWFGMRKGKRVTRDACILPDCPHLNAELPVNPCYSNQEMVSYVTDRIAEHIATIPEVALFNIWPHDGINNWCECPECLQKTPFEHVHNLALVLAEKISPDIMIGVLAYSNLLNKPKQSLPYSERLFVLFCPYLRPYIRRIYEDGGGELVLGTAYPDPDRIHPVDDRDYGKLYRIWQRVCEESGHGIGIFEYGNNLFDETRQYDHKRYQYSPDPMLRADEFDWYTQNQASILYFCAVFNSWPDAFHQTLMYKLFWNGGGILESYTKHFYSCFGSVGDELRNKMQNVSRRLMNNKDPASDFDEIKAITAKIPDRDLAERVCLWLDYIRMGRESRRLELEQNYHDAVANEEKIQQFLEENKNKLKRYTNWSMIFERVSANASKRFREKITGGKGINYNY